MQHFFVSLNLTSFLNKCYLLCRLLDSPGLVLASGSRTDASVALRNAVKVKVPSRCNGKEEGFRKVANVPNMSRTAAIGVLLRFYVFPFLPQ